ncbi:MAG: hypothetical protein ACI9YO_002960 [Gammaproteobacteria bacterium]
MLFLICLVLVIVNMDIIDLCSCIFFHIYSLVTGIDAKVNGTFTPEIILNRVWSVVLDTSNNLMCLTNHNNNVTQINFNHVIINTLSYNVGNLALSGKPDRPVIASPIACASAQSLSSSMVMQCPSSTTTLPSTITV